MGPCLWMALVGGVHFSSHVCPMPPFASSEDPIHEIMKENAKFWRFKAYESCMTCISFPLFLDLLGVMIYVWPDAPYSVHEFRVKCFLIYPFQNICGLSVEMVSVVVRL